jgi:hypothetical protein
MNKKLRGVRRYFRNLHRRASAYDLPFTESDWFDLWHTHPDWLGRGNKSGRYRREHLRAGLEIFNRIENKAKAYPSQYQLWVIIDRHDSAEDAVYVHTRNPNRDNFPYEYEGVSWSKEVPNLLKGIYDQESFEFGAENDSSFILARKKSIFP